MMTTYRILGHGNAALSMIIDSLCSRHGKLIAIEIVSNIDESANEYRQLEYGVDDVDIRECHSSSWQPTEFSGFVLGGMSPRTKKAIYEQFHREFGIETRMYAPVHHPLVTLGNGVRFGYGSHFGPGVTVAPYTQMGNFVTLNRHVSVGHHAHIEDFCTINPGANVAALCMIREGAQIGMGANILGQIEIGANAMVGAGSLVTKNVPAGTVVYGNPARIVREHKP